MFVFNPVTVTAPIQKIIDGLRKDAGSLASFGRIETANISVGAASGLANKATGLKADDNQRVEVGSQTKMMTATIVLQLAGEGKINLDDGVAKYLPVALIKDIANADTATVRQLLQMTSGIANYTDVAAPDGSAVWLNQLLANPDKQFDTGDALNIVRGQPAAGALGAFNYSNTNYDLLGHMIEGITGEKLAQTFESRIFTPAGMKNSDLIGATAPADLVRGYGTGPDGLIDTTEIKWNKYAEGGVVSTTADMIKFLKALLVDGKLLKPDQLNEMKQFILVAETPELEFSFGLGLVKSVVVGDGTYYGFNGGTLGFQSSTFLSEKTGNIASDAINFADFEGNIDETTLKLLKSVENNAAFKAIKTFDASRDVMKIQASEAATARMSTSDDFMARFCDVTLKLPLKLADVTTSNIKFADGSVLVVGDNKVGTSSDAAANKIDILKDYAGALAKDNQLIGLGGNDRLSGGLGDDRIVGGEGADTLRGRAGHDVLIGGMGRDVMSGGGDGDRFIFTSALDSGTTRATRDMIKGFDTGRDRISLVSIDANTTLEGNQAFHFIGCKPFHSTAGEMHLVRHGNGTIVEGDGNGDGKADFQIELSGLHKLMADDFIL
jgi:D-alanyl-D-alanine carboxypeptidase